MRALGLAFVCTALATVASGCGDPVNATPGSRTPPDPSSFATAYGVEPGTTLFASSEWGYAVTADGFGGFTLAMLGDTRYPNLEDRFFGSVYVDSTTTIANLGSCSGCQSPGATQVNAQRLDFDLFLLGAAQTDFTFKNAAGGGARVYMDLYVGGAHSGSWNIYFVNSDTGEKQPSTENPVAFTSP